MELDRRDSNRQVGLLREEEVVRKRVGAREEHGVDGALQSSENIGTEVLKRLAGHRNPKDMQQTHVDRADEVLGPRHDAGQEHGEQDGHDPCTNEALDGLLGRQLDELSASESHAANIGKDIVGDDQRSGEEEPDHALEDVVHDEVRLDDNEVQGHVRPCEVGELEPVVTSLERCDEEDEA